MPGFYVSNNCIGINLIDMFPERCVSEIMHNSKFMAVRNTLNKFMADKAFYSNEKYFVIVEGFLLNKLKLLDEYNVATVEDLVIQMYKHKGETFFNLFRGSFSGVLYEYSSDTWLIYTNHTGDSPVFYSFFDGEFFAASQVTYILDALSKTSHSIHLDEDGAYQILTFGFMERDNTFAKEIRRLRGGTYLCVKGGKVEVKQYHTFHKHSDRFFDKSEDEIISLLDEAFRHTVDLEYKKDDEYGYKHLVDMSGGLDSRMGAWVAHVLKPRHMQLLTYCKANYLDEKIAKQIAQYWNDEILVKPLDDLSFIYDIDEVIAANGGLSFYLGITGGRRMLDGLDLRYYGLEHTGMIGDIVIGSFYRQPNDAIQRKPSGKYSEKLSDCLNNVNDYENSFDDHEIYLLYTRAIQGAAITSLIRRNYTEMASPFMNVDFLQFCMDIPYRIRLNHKLYKKWIITRYKDAAQFKWEKINGLISEPEIISKLRHILHRGPNYFLRKIGKQNILAAGMNPIDFWLAHNDKARHFWDQYYEDNFKYIEKIGSERLCQDVKTLYSIGNANEKSMALTVLGAVKLYFFRDQIS